MTQVLDGTRILEFDGTLLGAATSDDGRAQRWTEVTIWRSETGRYIVSKVGRSAVYHTVNDECGRHGTKMSIAEAKAHLNENRLTTDDLIPCRNCEPDAVIGHGYNLEYSIEQPRYSAQVSETVEGLIESLHRRDNLGIKYLPLVARRALEAAVNRDPAVALAWKVQAV